MDPDRRKWLAEALDNMTISPVEEMTKNLKMIRDTLSATGERGDLIMEEACGTLVSALENITEYAGSVDCAKDFHKIGGFEVLDKLLVFPNASVSSMASELVAELVQNNPYCQREAAPHLKTLLRLVDSAQDQSTRIKALYAVSCLVRHNPPGYELFEQNDGFSVLLRTLQSDVAKLKVKACFLVSSLCSQEPRSRDTLLKMGFVEQMAALVQQEREGPHHEHLLGALAILCTENVAACAEARRPELGLEQFLRSTVESLAGRDECREEREHCITILDVCFKDATHLMVQADR